jgi:hypothetical protein
MTKSNESPAPRGTEDEADLNASGVDGANEEHSTPAPGKCTCEPPSTHAGKLFRRLDRLTDDLGSAEVIVTSRDDERRFLVRLLP